MCRSLVTVSRLAATLRLRTSARGGVLQSEHDFDSRGYDGEDVCG
jgi:hypothetical protein